jgi:hypothetical protein
VDYKDQTFEGGEVVFDGNTFENCTFRDVTFVFAGGDVRIKNCDMDRSASASTALSRMACSRSTSCSGPRAWCRSFAA